MKTNKILLGAVLAGALLSTSAFAVGVAPSAWPQATRTDKPTIAKVVNPTGLSMRHEGETVNVAFTVDKNGQPHNIRLLASSDANLERSLREALAQWRFNPAQKDGAPVATHVEMPIQLISSS